MPRGIDYNKRIFDIEKKIAAQEATLKELEDKRDELLTEKKKIELQVVLDCMEEKGLTVDELLNMVKDVK